MAPIPEDQLKKLQPGVDDLLAKLHALLEHMPVDTDSPLVFEPYRENRG